MPLPPSSINLPRSVPFQRQIYTHAYGGTTINQNHQAPFVTSPDFIVDNKTIPSAPEHYSHQIDLSGRVSTNWRDHLISSNPSPKSLLTEPPYNSRRGDISVSNRIPAHGPSPSLSSSSDQKSVGSEKRNYAAPLKPSKLLNQPTLEGITTSRTTIVPPSEHNLTKHDINTDEEEPDWEKEVSEKGDVFYVVPYMPSDTKVDNGSDQANNSNNDRLVTNSNDSNITGANKTSKKLSRLVRRRESKRDRINSGGNGLLSAKSEKPKFTGSSQHGTEDIVESNPKNISLLPGGMKPSPTSNR